MTLIELLVVIIILTTIVAAAIPIMAPADEDRRLREASRALNTFITSAQARAVATNRLYGIGLKRLSQDTKRPEDRAVCVQVYYVEQQPPYCGFDPNSAAVVALDNGPTGGAGQFLIRFVTRQGVPDLFPSSTIRPGDVVEISGNRFQLADTDFDPATGYYTPNSGNPNGTLVAIPMNGTGQQLNPRYDNRGREIGTVANPELPFYTAPAPYKIHRQPVTTADEPFQMPEGTAIDLRASGVGYSDYSYFHWPIGNDRTDRRVHDNDAPIKILFTPEGKVARLRYNLEYQPSTTSLAARENVFDEPVVDNMFLLIGQRGKIPPPALDRDITLTTNYPTEDKKDARERAREPINWLGGNSRWVVIGSQSGRIATVANDFVDPGTMGVSISSLGATEALRSQQILAARGLTRETTQETAR
jgi:type II secretory pathway pseudopilin PulG